MRRRRLGLLLIGAPESRATQTAAYARWLEQTGWKSAINLDLEYRWAAGDQEHLRQQAVDIANLAPDVRGGAWSRASDGPINSNCFRHGRRSGRQRVRQ
jgi:hypothetical protein